MSVPAGGEYLNPFKDWLNGTLTDYNLPAATEENKKSVADATAGMGKEARRKAVMALPLFETFKQMYIPAYQKKEAEKAAAAAAEKAARMEANKTNAFLTDDAYRQNILSKINKDPFLVKFIPEDFPDRSKYVRNPAAAAAAPRAERDARYQAYKQDLERQQAVQKEREEKSRLAEIEKERIKAEAKEVEAVQQRLIQADWQKAEVAKAAAAAKAEIEGQEREKIAAEKLRQKEELAALETQLAEAGRTFQEALSKYQNRDKERTGGILGRSIKGKGSLGTWTQENTDEFEGFKEELRKAEMVRNQILDRLTEKKEIYKEEPVNSSSPIATQLNRKRYINKRINGLKSDIKYLEEQKLDVRNKLGLGPKDWNRIAGLGGIADVLIDGLVSRVTDQFGNVDVKNSEKIFDKLIEGKNEEIKGLVKELATIDTQPSAPTTDVPPPVSEKNVEQLKSLQTLVRGLDSEDAKLLRGKFSKDAKVRSDSETEWKKLDHKQQNKAKTDYDRWNALTPLARTLILNKVKSDPIYETQVKKARQLRSFMNSKNAIAFRVKDEKWKALTPERQADAERYTIEYELLSPVWRLIVDDYDEQGESNIETLKQELSYKPNVARYSTEWKFAKKIPGGPGRPRDMYAPYQLMPMERMAGKCRDMPGIILFHSMGSGKTRTALGLAASLTNKPNSVTIIVPKGLQAPWINEMADLHINSNKGSDGKYKQVQLSYLSQMKWQIPEQEPTKGWNAYWNDKANPLEEGDLGTDKAEGARLAANRLAQGNYRTATTKKQATDFNALRNVPIYGRIIKKPANQTRCERLRGDEPNGPFKQLADKEKDWPSSQEFRYNIITYDKLLEPGYDKLLRDHILIFDEAHNLLPIYKGSACDESQQYKLKLRIESAKRIIFLTGTPIQTEMTDLAILVNLSQKACSDPIIVDLPNRFREVYYPPADGESWQWKLKQFSSWSFMGIASVGSIAGVGAGATALAGAGGMLGWAAGGLAAVAGWAAGPFILGGLAVGVGLCAVSNVLSIGISAASLDMRALNTTLLAQHVSPYVSFFDVEYDTPELKSKFPYKSKRHIVDKATNILQAKIDAAWTVAYWNVMEGKEATEKEYIAFGMAMRAKKVGTAVAKAVYAPLGIALDVAGAVYTAGKGALAASKQVVSGSDVALGAISAKTLAANAGLAAMSKQGPYTQAQAAAVNAQASRRGLSRFLAVGDAAAEVGSAVRNIASGSDFVSRSNVLAPTNNMGSLQSALQSEAAAKQYELENKVIIRVWYNTYLNPGKKLQDIVQYGLYQTTEPYGLKRPNPKAGIGFELTSDEGEIEHAVPFDAFQNSIYVAQFMNLETQSLDIAEMLDNYNDSLAKTFNGFRDKDGKVNSDKYEKLSERVIENPSNTKEFMSKMRVVTNLSPYCFYYEPLISNSYLDERVMKPTVNEPSEEEMNAAFARVTGSNVEKKNAIISEIRTIRSSLTEEDVNDMLKDKNITTIDEFKKCMKEAAEKNVFTNKVIETIRKQDEYVTAYMKSIQDQTDKVEELESKAKKTEEAAKGAVANVNAASKNKTKEEQEIRARAAAWKREEGLISKEAERVSAEEAEALCQDQKVKRNDPVKPKFMGNNTYITVYKQEFWNQSAKGSRKLELPTKDDVKAIPNDNGEVQIENIFTAPKFEKILDLIITCRQRNHFLPLVYSNFDKYGFQLLSAFLNNRGVRHLIIHSHDDYASWNTTMLNEKQGGLTQMPWPRYKRSKPTNEDEIQAWRAENAEELKHYKEYLNNYPVLKNDAPAPGEPAKRTTNDIIKEALLDLVENKEYVPMCILLHPDIKEGLSFTMQPEMMVLEVPLGIGNRDQIYARIIRALTLTAQEGIPDSTYYKILPTPKLDPNGNPIVKKDKDGNNIKKTDGTYDVEMWPGVVRPEYIKDGIFLQENMICYKKEQTPQFLASMHRKTLDKDGKPIPIPSRSGLHISEKILNMAMAVEERGKTEEVGAFTSIGASMAKSIFSKISGTPLDDLVYEPNREKHEQDVPRVKKIIHQLYGADNVPRIQIPEVIRKLSPQIPSTIRANLLGVSMVDDTECDNSAKLGYHARRIRLPSFDVQVDFQALKMSYEAYWKQYLGGSAKAWAKIGTLTFNEVCAKMPVPWQTIPPDDWVDNENKRQKDEFEQIRLAFFKNEEKGLCIQEVEEEVDVLDKNGKTQKNRNGQIMRKTIKVRKATETKNVELPCKIWRSPTEPGTCRTQPLKDVEGGTPTIDIKQVMNAQRTTTAKANSVAARRQIVPVEQLSSMINSKYGRGATDFASKALAKAATGEGAAGPLTDAIAGMIKSALPGLIVQGAKGINTIDIDAITKQANVYYNRVVEAQNKIIQEIQGQITNVQSQLSSATGAARTAIETQLTGLQKAVAAAQLKISEAAAIKQSMINGATQMSQQPANLGNAYAALNAAEGRTYVSDESKALYALNHPNTPNTGNNPFGAAPLKGLKPNLNGNTPRAGNANRNVSTPRPNGSPTASVGSDPRTPASVGGRRKKHRTTYSKHGRSAARQTRKGPVQRRKTYARKNRVRRNRTYKH